jgi:hypothetical protein
MPTRHREHDHWTDTDENMRPAAAAAASSLVAYDDGDHVVVTDPKNTRAWLKSSVTVDLETME